MASVTETCSCGARLAYVGEYPRSAARDWRAGHRHDSAKQSDVSRVAVQVDSEQVAAAIRRTAWATPVRRRRKRRFVRRYRRT